MTRNEGRYDVGFRWFLVATKNDYKSTVGLTLCANWEGTLVRLQLGIQTKDTLMEYIYTNFIK